MKLFGKKAVELTNEEKVSATKAKVEGALNTFANIYSELEEANVTLAVVVAEDKQSVEKLNHNIEQAQAELVANKELQEKLKPFIKGATE